MSIITATVTLNPAFLREIKEDNQELFSLLKTTQECLKSAEDRRLAQSPKALAETLERLRDRLAMHFALEEGYGYFEDPISVAQQIATEAERLRQEHQDLYAQASGLAERAAQVLYHETPAAAVREIRTSFEHFHRQFQRHEARENELIMRSLYEDVGVGD